ncbi:MAG: ATP-dependent DNA helicase chl1 [Caeruleum heppii]|nr:MAG: ATP-dependent DNA helicase chl1 [Caeruleum heppii]
MQSSAALDGKDFHHPYQPYDIQIEFMKAVYECIEEGKVGIFESPTDQDEPAWMLEHAREQKRQNAFRRKADTEARLAQIRAREQRQRERYANGEPASKKLKAEHDGNDVDGDDDTRFMLDDYESDGEHSTENRKATAAGLSVETQALMKKLGIELQKPKEDDADVEDEVKIFYCSRTHSQLTQFVNELRRVKIPPALETAVSDKEEAIEVTLVTEELKHVSLGSRKNLCINSKVAKLAGATAVNERCLELQQPDTPKDCKCPYLPTKENETLVNDFRDHTLARIRDIEDLGTLGKRLGICPYYASRSVIKPSEIVTLPYPLLLQRPAREALDLSLKDHVVIIDEAHNLMDAISNIHSISVSLSQLQRSRAQLGIYLQKFRNRLKGKNRVYVTQIVRLLDSLAGFLEAKKKEERGEMEGIVEDGDLMKGKGVDQINLYKLMAYLQTSKLARKVEGYIQYTTDPDGLSARSHQKGPPVEAAVPVLTHIQGFLLALTHPSAEGKIFFTKDEMEGISLKYMLLDPTHHFREIVEDARAVILAGGTMSPMNDYITQLFNYIPSARLKTVSCGHVIPTENLLAFPVSRGPSGVDFEFTFEKRNNNFMIDELGHAFIELCQKIPDGVVIFFPSYAYLDRVVQRWKMAKHGGATIYAALSQLKPIFLDDPHISTSPPNPKLTSNATSSPPTDSTLTRYTRTILSPTPTTAPHRGALLLSVISGRMSEGINFSDALARAVIVVGLPFPNPHASGIRAKLDFLAHDRPVSSPANSSHSFPQETKDTREIKRQALENMAMRAVNQSIGRAIRHRGDYAVVLLFDARYARGSIEGKLPGWIRRGLVRWGGGGGGGVDGDGHGAGQGKRGFGDVVRGVEGFFVGR